MQKIKILIADDHKVIVDGLKAIFESESDMLFVGEASNGLEVLKLLKNTEVDVVLLDINMPIMDGLECTKLIKKEFEKVYVLGLTMNDNPRLARKMISNGASGFLLKKANKEKILSAIRTVYSGQKYFDNDLMLSFLEPNKPGQFSNFSKRDLLSSREIEIVREIYSEATTNEIADKLCLSPYTVETHKSNIYSKLGIKNQVGLIKWAINNEII
tara:strand:- start:160 stop:801 length:642 start_codon:yes stop_codon:yes gene_type:complete